MTIGINSITQVSVTIASGATTGTTTVSSPTGTYILLWQGNSTTATTSFAQSFGRISISGTTVTATRNTSSTNTVTVNAVLIDADSSLVASVQMGTIAITSGTSNTATISSVTTANSAVALLGFTAANTTFDFEINNPVLVLTNSTTVTASVARLTTNCTAGYIVVEFQGAALNQATQPFSKVWTNSSISTTQTITSVNVNNSMLFYAGCHNGDTVADAEDQQRGIITNSTTVTITSGIADSDANLKYNGTVVEFVSGVLSQNAQRGTTTIAASTSSKTDTVTSADTTASVLNFTGWTSTTVATTSIANILPRITQVNATSISATIDGTVPSGKNTISGWELLTFTKMGGGTTYNDFITETATSSDSETGSATDNASLSETGTATNSQIGTANDNASLSETSTTSDSYVGGKRTSDTLIESAASSDLYNGAATGRGNMTEQIIPSDNFAGTATDRASLTESAAANDNYTASNTPGPTVVTVITTGSGDDPWRKYLAWLARKKKAEFKKNAARAGIQEAKAAKIADMAAQEVLRQEIDLKTPYYALLEKNAEKAKQEAQAAILAIYDIVWQQMAIQKREIITLKLDVEHAIAENEEDEEEFFLMMM